MSRIHLKLGILVTFFLFSGVSAVAQEVAGFPFPVSHYRLKNGLAVILSEDDSLPLVSVVVAYRAGSIYEQPGKTGLAYLLENIMFMGSQNVGPMQHLSTISRVGGEPNAGTTEDMTFFYQTVPSNQLALVLWMESDRMKFLEITPAKVERARTAVLDEFAQRKSSDPYLASSWAFDRLLYPDFAHSHDFLGKQEDIRSITPEDVIHFYESYYVPSNAVLTIVGNINPSRTRELVEKYFETIPSGKELPVFLPPKPSEKKEVLQSFAESSASVPAFHLGYRMPVPYFPEYYPLVILDYILLKGQSSRLYSRIIKKENLALYLGGGVEKRKDVAVFKIFGTANNETMVDLCQKAVLSEINRLKTGLVSQSELQKAKMMFKRDYVSRFSTSVDRALYLAEAFYSGMRLDVMAMDLARHLRVTAMELSIVARRYLTPENSVILNVKIE